MRPSMACGLVGGLVGVGLVVFGLASNSWRVSKFEVTDPSRAFGESVALTILITVVFAVVGLSFGLVYEKFRGPKWQITSTPDETT